MSPSSSISATTDYAAGTAVGIGTIPKTTALYERLSRYDQLRGESGSITHQKDLLSNFARRSQLPSPTHFTDDGISGTKFDRPAFQALLRGIAIDRIDTVIVKDLSRLGRDYLAVGYLIENFRQRNVRLISLGDNIDTFREEDDFLPIRNLMNEWYVKDTSKKLHTIMKAKGMAGRHLTAACPYGYVRDESDKEKWIPDPGAAEVIRRIFRMTISGVNMSRIAKALRTEKIEMPGAHIARITKGTDSDAYKRYEDPYKWTSRTILTILNRKEYTGCTINFKATRHYKDQNSHALPEENWMVFENTQEAIVSTQTFENAHRAMDQARDKRRTRVTSGSGVENNNSAVKIHATSTGVRAQTVQEAPAAQPAAAPTAHPLTKYLYCADCGSGMYFRHRSDGRDGKAGKNGKDSVNGSSFVCSAYMRHPYKTHCHSSHYVTVQAVEDALRAELLRLKKAVKEDGIEALETPAAIPHKTLTLRIAELKAAMQKHFEDFVIGKIAQDEYESLSSTCEREIEMLQQLQEGSGSQLASSDLESEMFKSFLLAFDPNAAIDYVELDNYLDRIIVHERDRKYSCQCGQKIQVVMKHF